MRFFHKLRKQLAYQNRFFAYARYAIGEIVLVVIGILIALQVTNWNEDRKNANRERRLLKAVQKEMESNIEVGIRTLLRLKSMDSLITGLDTQIIDLDSLTTSQLFDYVRLPDRTVSIPLEEAAYENFMGAIGEIESTQEEITLNLARLYSRYFRNLVNDRESLDLNRSYSDNVFGKENLARTINPENWSGEEEVQKTFRDFIENHRGYAFYLRAYHNKILFERILDLTAFIALARETNGLIGSSEKNTYTDSSVDPGPEPRFDGKYSMIKDPQGFWRGGNFDTLILSGNKLRLVYEEKVGRPDATASILHISPEAIITYDFLNVGSDDKPYYFVDRVPSLGDGPDRIRIEGIIELEKVAEVQ